MYQFLSGGRVANTVGVLKFLWKRYGFFGSIGRVYAKFFRWASPSIQRRQSRLASEGLEFDRRYGTDTIGLVHPANLGAAGGNVLFAGGYEAVPPKFFRELIDTLPIDPAEFVFIDFGSGKGRALLLAAQRPFKKIIGVELSPKLHEIAARNIAIFPEAEKRCKDIASVHIDAEEFEAPEGRLVCYFYHPFGVKVLDSVLDGIKKSIDRVPRQVFILYANVDPVARASLESRGWLRFSHRFEWSGVWCST